MGAMKTMVPREKLLAVEGLAALVCLALLGLGTLVYVLEPVGAPPDTGHSQAPWIFVGLQQLLAWMPSWLAGLLLPALGLGLWAALPWIGKKAGSVTAAAVGLAVMAAWLGLTALGLWG